MKRIISLLCIGWFALTAGAQVVVNEISPSNNLVITDEDGEAPDWIELYNPGGTAVSLGGYRISDNVNNPSKWIFPSGTSIPASGFLTLFASGKDRKDFFDHWECVVKADGNWKYLVPLTEPDSNWRKLPSFNDAPWNSGPGGIGYGDGDDNTILTPPVASVFMRKVFSIVDTADIAGAVLHIDYDDAFVAYLNGVEIARSNIGVNGVPTPFNDPAFAEHEARMYAGGKPEQFFLSESFLKSALVNGNNVLALQIHNLTPTSSDLSALPWLSLGIKSASSNYMPVPAWFGLNASFLHTNFKLSQSGETVVLSDNSGTVLSLVNFGAILTDDSYGRQPDGSANLRFFGKPTPGASNNSVNGYTGYAADAVLTPVGGFYSSAQNLMISSASPGAVIRYTTDGSVPDSSAPVYTSPLLIDSTKVIRARAFHASLLEGNPAEASFFIHDSSSPQLPVVSLIITPELLFDPVKGIYVKGPNAEASVPFFGANFWQEVEIPVHIEYYDKQRQQGFSQNAGLEIYGNYSRSYPQKSMKLIARDGYGDGSFDYQLFPSKDIHSFKQFILRNAGTDWNSAHMRDAFAHSLAQQVTNSDVMAYQPCVVYVNGKYWGLYNMREKINKHYLADNHGVNPDSVDLLQYNGLVMSGSNENFLQMGWYVLTHNMADSAEFEVVKNWVDLENFADYFALETWTNNWDWLTNNVRYWRERKPDAKWRYILWDLDNGLGGLWSYVTNSLEVNLNKTTDYTSLLFSRLMKNKKYRDYFINRYADLLNTTLTPQNFSSALYRFKDSVDSEMPRHFSRWGSGFNEPAWGVAGHGSYNDWQGYQLNELAAFSMPRQVTARDHIQQTFELKKQVAVTLNVYPPGAGKIHINTITIEDMPWAGIYFDSVPVTITAIPNPGYTFSFWQSGILFPSPFHDSILTFNPDTADVFTAYFFGSPDTTMITMSEINYSSSPASEPGDWVELHNHGQYPFDISGWKFKDSQNDNIFLFPAGTVLQAGQYLVLCEDTALFRSIFPAITNITGPFNFGLSAAGDAVRLFDNEMNIYLEVDFSPFSPWPAQANGTGRTLELINAAADLNDPYNWFAGCPGGSPGGPFIPCDNSGTEEFAADAMISVYPNPASDQLFVKIDPEYLQHGPFTFVIYDLYGKAVIREKNITRPQTTVQPQLAPGLYFYRLTSKEGNLKQGKVVFR